jgi:hypothetical protein
MIEGNERVKQRRTVFAFYKTGLCGVILRYKYIVNRFILYYNSFTEVNFYYHPYICT